MTALVTSKSDDKAHHLMADDTTGVVVVTGPHVPAESAQESLRAFLRAEGLIR